MREHPTTMETLQACCHAWFVQLDLDKTLAFLTDDIDFVGWGQDAFAQGKAEMAAFLKRSLPKTAEPFDVQLSCIHTRLLTSQICNLSVDLILENTRGTQTLRGFFILLQQDNVWRIQSLHLAPLCAGAQDAALCPATQPAASTAQQCQEINFQTADSVYIINKDTYELLYLTDVKKLFGAQNSASRVGQKCYFSLYHKNAPCDFCILNTHGADDQAHEITVTPTGQTYIARVKETVWNGVGAYIQHICDVTEKVRTRQEKERLEIYCQTLIQNLPGGVSVIRCWRDGRMTPEYISDTFAALTHMTVEEAFALYGTDIFLGLHEEDVAENRVKLDRFLKSGAEHCELEARFKQGDGGYVWVRIRLSAQKVADGTRRLYCFYADITRLVQEKEQLRRQYEELILQHYHAPGPNTLILGHCNITANKILAIWDSTASNLLEAFGRNRETFFTRLAGLITDPDERQAFLNTYLTAPALQAFARNETEKVLTCFIKLPQEQFGRYVQFKVNMVEVPDTGEITGILSVTDMTDQTISEQILRRLSVTSHDYVVDLNLEQDFYTILTYNKDACLIPPLRGCYSQRVAFMANSAVVPKDRNTYVNALAPSEMKRRLQETGLYTFAYSLEDETGAVRTKNMTVSAIDLRLGRISLVCTDITSSVREQQSLLSILAYTFELVGMINVNDKSFVMYTRQMVLEHLPPFTSPCYDDALQRAASADAGTEAARKQLCLDTMLQRLAASPKGYDVVFPFQVKGDVRYKQYTILWGDQNRGIVCMVRADVTEMLAAERQAKNALESALTRAEEASQAKSDFLSSMSHDIRTPMNAIMGMTTLAAAHLDERDRVADCLHKISISSKHLLSLVNDVLDMSRIERAQIALNQVKISLPELIDQLSVMIVPQAKAAGVQFNLRLANVAHPFFYGDTLRINQILINLLSNAVKFTPEGGQVDFDVTEVSPVQNPEGVRYRFMVSDTGIGMTPAFLERVFAPFARDSGAVHIEGTGLGLSIVHGLVEMMQGIISVESRLHKGSVFEVELEFEAAHSAAHDAAQALRAGFAPASENILAGRCFLVAEDNLLNAEILCEILKIHGAKSVLTADGAQAVQAFQDAAPGTYDGILMDIQMPNMNGYEAARAIRALARPDAKDIPIVALTANAFAEDIQRAAKAGMSAHVAKPIDMEVLRVTLHRVLTSQPPGKRRFAAQ